MLDSEAIITSQSPDDIGTMVLELAGKINYKLALLLLFIFLVLTSDVFIGRVLSRFPGAVEYKSSTSYGTVLQGILLVIFFVCLDVLIRVDVI